MCQHLHNAGCFVCVNYSLTVMAKRHESKCGWLTYLQKPAADWSQMLLAAQVAGPDEESALRL